MKLCIERFNIIKCRQTLYINRNLEREREERYINIIYIEKDEIYFG